jgi:hypothetical protein
MHPSAAANRIAELRRRFRGINDLAQAWHTVLMIAGTALLRDPHLRVIRQRQ